MKTFDRMRPVAWRRTGVGKPVPYLVDKAASVIAGIGGVRLGRRGGFRATSGAADVPRRRHPAPAVREKGKHWLPLSLSLLFRFRTRMIFFSVQARHHSRTLVRSFLQHVPTNMDQNGIAKSSQHIIFPIFFNRLIFVHFFSSFVKQKKRSPCW